MCGGSAFSEVSEFNDMFCCHCLLASAKATFHLKN